MRKSGWAVAAAAFGSLVLLTACGGSSSSSSTSTSANSTSTSANSGTTPVAGGQPSSALSSPPPGTLVLIVERSSAGWVLAEASGVVVYTYGGDTKGGQPSCTGSCSSFWLPVTGLPQVGPADSLPKTLGTVATANGAKQITYNGYPLYTLKGAGALTTRGNGMNGMWHVVKLSKSDVTAAG